MTPERGAGGLPLVRDLRSALDRLTRPPLAAAAAALMLALLLGVVGLHLAGLQPPAGGRIDIGTGDFLAFWNGAVAVHDGEGKALYDLDAQKRVQTRILGGESPEFQPYLNPPLLALLLAPLVPLGYVGAFYAYDAVCVLFLAAGLAMLARMVPTIRAQPLGTLTLVVVVASYQPMLQTTFGGQNTPITFGLLAALALALSRGAWLAAALVLGLLSYKPQYAVGIGIALVMANQWRVAFGGGLVALAHWLAGAWWSGPAWPLDMLAFMQRYRPSELAENASMHFSWVRTADYVLPSPFDTAAAAAGVLAVLLVWWRYRGLGRRGDAAWIALVVCGTMLASPHQQYYDAALLTLPVCLLVDRELQVRRSVPLGMRIFLAAAYAGYALWEAAPAIGVQPLFFVLLAIFLWAVRACHDGLRLQPATPADSPWREKRPSDAHATA